MYNLGSIYLHHHHHDKWPPWWPNDTPPHIARHTTTMTYHEHEQWPPQPNNKWPTQLNDEGCNEDEENEGLEMRHILSPRYGFPFLFLILFSVLKSGSVPFFSVLGMNRNRNQLSYIHRLQKTRLNRTQPVVCGSVQPKSRFEPTQPRLVVMQLKSV